MISFKTLKITIIFSLFFLLNSQFFADEAVNIEAQSDETSLSIISNNENSLTIDEIIVTAENETRELQDVSKAVTALGADELETKNIVDFVGLSAIAPGVTVAKNEGYKTVISIRGVGDETNQNAIAAPSVALHMDGIFIASKFSLRTDFIDLERIEVLRGPQGTLFGQNSTGGTVNVISKLPSFDGFEGKADITLGNYNLTKVRGSFNTPLSENVPQETLLLLQIETVLQII